jgi:hypothetical protein
LAHHAQGPWPPHRQEDCWCHRPIRSWGTASKRLHKVGHSWPGFRS